MRHSVDPNDGDWEGNQMSKKQRHSKDAETRKQIERTVRRTLALLIAFLVMILLVLLFRLGEGWWPGWMIEYQVRIEGILALVISVLILASPLIVEVSSKPRALSGPGKNPEGPRLP